RRHKIDVKNVFCAQQSANVLGPFVVSGYDVLFDRHCPHKCYYSMNAAGKQCPTPCKMRPAREFSRNYKRLKNKLLREAEKAGKRFPPQRAIQSSLPPEFKKAFFRPYRNVDIC
ncbi:MAG: hypothetical protein II697_00815, partial [Clostridia bacterium]|nr:hypothetical protein [Clostridia bacterium]